MKKILFPEFVTLMALYVSLMAMSIDMILPALSFMQQEFALPDENETQFVIGAIFLGFAFGQIIYGPIADSFGRKFTIYIGLIIFACGSVLGMIAGNFHLMILGRLLQGFGAAAPRIISVAITRDLYQGREMARVMSFIMTIFILVPVIAPSIGQAILLVASWRVMFFIFLIFSLIATIWTFLRLPETLKTNDVRPFNIKAIWHDFVKVFQNKITMTYAICAGLIFAAMIGYLTSSRQIFQDYFQVGNLFPLYFGASALSIGISSIVNSMIVRRYGMKIICHQALKIMIAATVIFLFINILQHQKIMLWQFMTFTLTTFFCLGLLFGNLNALAMEPMGHVAGIAAAVIGFLSSVISALIGSIIGQAYNNSLTPMIVGFLLLTSTAFLLKHLVEKS